MPPKRRQPSKRNKAAASPESAARTRKEAKQKSNSRVLAKAQNALFLEKALTSALRENDVPDHSRSGHVFVSVKGTISKTSEIKSEVCDPLDLSQNSKAVPIASSLTSDAMELNALHLSEDSSPSSPQASDTSVQTPSPMNNHLSDSSEDSPFPPKGSKRKRLVTPSPSLTEPMTPTTPKTQNNLHSTSPPPTNAEKRQRTFAESLELPQASSSSLAPGTPCQEHVIVDRSASPLPLAPGTPCQEHAIVDRSASPLPLAPGTPCQEHAIVDRTASPLPSTSGTQGRIIQHRLALTEQSLPEASSYGTQQQQESPPSTPRVPKTASASANKSELMAKFNKQAESLKQTREKNKKLLQENAELKDLLMHAYAEAKKAKEGDDANMTFTTDPDIQVTVEDLERINGVSKHAGAFAQNLSMHLYGADQLRNLSVKGKKCNRFNDGRQPRQAMSPKKLEFIYDKVRERVAMEVGSKNLKQITLLANPALINRAISEKIANLNKALHYAELRASAKST